MRKNYLLIICILLCMSVTGCMGDKDILKDREEFSISSEVLTIGIPGPMAYMKEITGFYNGVMEAVEEINSTGGIDGKEINVVFEDDKGTFNDGIKIAQEFAHRKDIFAVIGHWNTYITLPAAEIYNDAGIVMLSPVVSNNELTKKGYNYVFQNIINDSDMGSQIAQYVYEQGHKRIVVFYVENDYGKGLAKAFEDSLSDTGGTVIDRVTDFANEIEFSKAYNKWKALEYDAVFIADSMPHAGEFIKKLRQRDSDMPIFSGDGLDVAELPSMLGKAANEITIATMYNPNTGSLEQNEFIKQYTEKYDLEPDLWAMQGYDSIKLLAYAFKNAKDLTPSGVSQILKAKTGWEGIMGITEFNLEGQMTGRKVFWKRVQNGEMEYMTNK